MALATGTFYTMPSLSARKTKHRLAFFATTINVGLAFPNTVAKQPILTADFIPKTQKALVFYSSFANVSGEGSADAHHKQSAGQPVKDRIHHRETAEKEADDCKKDTGEKEKIVKIIRAVASLHKACYSFAQSHEFFSFHRGFLAKTSELVNYELFPLEKVSILSPIFYPIFPFRSSLLFYQNVNFLFPCKTALHFALSFGFFGIFIKFSLNFTLYYVKITM